MDERYYQHGNNIVSYKDLKNQYGAEVDNKINELNLAPIDELQGVDQPQNTTLPAVDNVPREVIKITKNVHEKGEQNQWVYTPETLKAAAEKQGITSEEFLDQYRVSGSAYSVTTNTITQEQLNKAKSTASNLVEGIGLPADAVEVEGAGLQETGELMGEKTFEFVEAKSGDFTNKYNSILNSVTSEDNQSAIAEQYFNLGEFNQFRNDNAISGADGGWDGTTAGSYYGGGGGKENRPLELDEKEYFGEMYDEYQIYKKTGVIPKDKIKENKAHDNKLKLAEHMVLADVKDAKIQEWLNNFSKEDRYKIQVAALQNDSDWPETISGLNPLELEVLRVSKDKKDFKKGTGKDLVGKKILNGRVYNDKVDIEKLIKTQESYRKNQYKNLENTESQITERSDAYDAYIDKGQEQLNDIQERYNQQVHNFGVFQGPVANAGIRAKISEIEGEYNNAYNKLDSTSTEMSLKLNKDIKAYEAVVNDFNEKGEKFNNLSFLTHAAALNYNNVDRALLNVEKGILGAGSLFFTKTALNLGRAYDWAGDGEYATSEETMKVLEDMFGNSVNWNEEMDKDLQTNYARPIEIRSDNVSSWAPQLLADGAPSMLMVMAPLGVAKMLGYAVRGAATTLNMSRFAALRTSKNLMSAGYKTVMGSFFVSETGSKAYENEIQLRKSKELLDPNNPQGLHAQLNKAKKNGITSEVHALNQRIFEQNRIANDVGNFQRAISEYLYGGVAMYAESLGSLRYIQNFQKMAGGMGKSRFRKLLGVGYAGVSGVIIEDIEESVTQFLQNSVDDIVLGESKNWFEGLDSTRFHMQNVVNSFGLQGGNISMNAGNLLLDEIRTRYNNHYNKKSVAELADVTKRLKDNTLTAKERQPLIERKRQLLVEANLHNAVTYHQLAYMKPDQIIELGELNRKRRENAGKQHELGRSGQYTSKSGKQTLDNLTTEMEVIEERRNEILNRNKAVNSDQNFLQGVYDLAYETAKLKSKNSDNVIEINPEHIVNLGNGVIAINEKFENNYKAEHLDQIKKLIAEGGNGKNIDGTMYINKQSITSKITSATLDKEAQKEFTDEELPIVQRMEAFRAALTPMHELFHNDADNTKFSDSDIYKNGVEELKLHMKNKLGDKEINSAQHKYFEKILDQYSKKDQADEILPLVYELIEMGMIKASDFSFLYGVRNSLDNMVNTLFPDAKMFFPFNTNEDVFNYVSNFYKTKESSDLIDTPEEVTPAEAKKSLGLQTFNLTDNTVREITNWENLTKEQKLEQGILMAYTWENYIKKRMKGLGFKAPDREIEMMAQEFVFDTKRGLPEIFSRYNPTINDSISAWALSGKEGWGQLDLRLLETFEKSGYYNAFQVEQDKEDSKELKADIADDSVNEILDVLGFKDNIKLPKGINKKVKIGVEKAIVKYANKNLTPKQLRIKLTADFRKIVFKELKNSFKSRKDYKSYMGKNFPVIFGKMPKTTLAKRFRSDEKTAKTYNEDRDLFIKPAINPETGVQYRISKTNTSQPGVWFKPDIKDINKDKINDYFFGEQLSAQMVSNRKTAITEEISNELAFDEAINALFDIETLKVDSDKIKGLIPTLESKNKNTKEKAEAFSETVVKAIDRRIKMSKGLGTEDQVVKIREVFADPSSKVVFNKLLASNDFGHTLSIKPLLSRLLLDDSKLFTKPDITKLAKKLDGIFSSLLQIKVSKPKNVKFDVIDYLNKFVEKELSPNDMGALLKKHGYDVVVYDQTDLDDILGALHVYSLLAEHTDIAREELNTLLYAMAGNSRMGGGKFKWNGKKQTVKELLDSKNYKWVKSMSTSKNRFGLLESIALARTFLKVKGDYTAELVTGKDEDGEDIKTKVTRTASALSKHTSSPVHRVLIKEGYDEKTITELKQTGEVNQAMLIKTADAVRDLFQDGLIGKKALQGFMSSLDSTQKGLLRTGALFGYIPKLSYSELVSKFNLQELTDEKGNKYIPLEVEHMIPTKIIKGLMFDYIIGKKKTNLFKTALKEYKLAILPKGVNEMLPNSLKYRMNIGWEVGNKSSDRYDNILTNGIFGIELIDLYSETRETIGREAQSDALVNLNKNVLKGNVKVLGKYFDLPSIKAQVELARLNDAAKGEALKLGKESKGISVVDFDDTLAISDSKVIVEMKDGMVLRWTPAEFAQHAETVADMVRSYDFSEFNKVKKGKKGPFFDKAKALKEKFGNTDIFILTARPPGAKYAIQAFLRGVGLDIKIDNIIGLEDGRPEAKADWIKQKVVEGYNDFLFADDQIKNVEAVKQVLDIADVKGKVYQARVKASKGLSDQINKIIEQTKGIPEQARFSEAAARLRGYSIGKWNVFIPPGAEDFAGLMYEFLGKGKVGEQQQKWFEEILYKPFAKGIRDINTAKQTIANDYTALKKKYPDVFKLLDQETNYNKFTYENAIRVYLWNKHGIDIPGLSKRDTAALTKIVKADSQLLDFASNLSALTKIKEGYITPGEHWLGGSIKHDIHEVNTTFKRADYLKDWIDNKNQIFSKENLNKMEAAFGTAWVDALKDMLWRMETGKNRGRGQNKLVNEFQDWINGSIATTMFWNFRSATLQFMSFVNFTNWSDNNPLAAGGAIANQPRFWRDFGALFNSDFLKQRRSGLQIDINASELASVVASPTGASAYQKIKALFAYMLKKGYKPTQFMDSVAIAFGGATFYRNRMNTYLKQGMDQKTAEKKAFGDFQEIAESTQQSARPDLISQEQASILGRMVLAFQNVTMQYNRQGKKAIRDLYNRRGSDITNISKVTWYLAVQNLIFNFLQQGLFALFTGEEWEEEKKEGKNNLIPPKIFNLVNKMGDSILRGAGVRLAVLSSLKNVVLQAHKQHKKQKNKERADYTYVLLEALNVSPPVGIRASKFYSALKTYEWENRKKDPWSGSWADPNHPAYEASTKILSASVNVPADRLLFHANTVKGVLDSELATWQRIAMAAGWPAWSIGATKDKPKSKSIDSPWFYNEKRSFIGGTKKKKKKKIGGKW